MNASSFDPKRLAVVSGRHPASKFASDINHRAYCERHGYTYVHCGWPTRADNPYFNKIEYLRHYAPNFDWIFWIDDDAFFMDLDAGLEQFLPPEGQFLSICASPDNKAIHTYVSSGQFLLRGDATGIDFLDAVTGVDLAEVREWWTPELGYFSNGDQDAIVHLLKTDDRFRGGYTRHHHDRFNSRPSELVAGKKDAFIVHFTGPPKTKHRDHRHLAKHLQLPPTLLPPDVEKLWIDRPSWPRARRLFGPIVRRLR